MLNINITKPRLKAFTLHVCVSLIIVSFVLVGLKAFFYPGPILTLTGADRVFGLILLVDVCLGPLLTFVVYDLKKDPTELKRDVTLIILIQMCALLYGSYALFGARPVYAVFAIDRFELVQASQLSTEQLNEVQRDQFRKVPITPLEWVYAEFPVSQKERNQILFNQIDHGIDLAQSPKYYRSIEFGKDTIREKVIPIKVLLDELKGNENFKNLLDELSQKEAQLGYLPITGPTLDMLVVIDLSSMSILKILNVDPWELDG